VERLSHELGKDVSEISADALKLLMDYDWPGNVRELENAVERAIVTAKARVLTEDDFGFLSRKMESGANGRIPVNVTLQELERQAIAAAIQRTSGNIKEAAAALGIDRSTLYEKIKRYEIPRAWRN
jgi:two-component system response regulator HydG